MSDQTPFKIKISPDGTYFDDEHYTHLDEDVLYVRVADHPIETALKLLSEQGYKVSIHAEAKCDEKDQK